MRLKRIISIMAAGCILLIFLYQAAGQTLDMPDLNPGYKHQVLVHDTIFWY